MRLGHLHLGSGISGDMFLSVLSSGGVALSVMEEAVRAVGGGRLSLVGEAVTRGAIRATHVAVRLDGSRIEEKGGPGDEPVFAQAMSAAGESVDWTNDLLHGTDHPSTSAPRINPTSSMTTPSQKHELSVVSLR